MLREGGPPPTYVGHGVVFVQVLAGEDPAQVKRDFVRVVQQLPFAAALHQPIAKVQRMPRPHRVSEMQHVAGLGEIQQRLAHLSVDELRIVREAEPAKTKAGKPNANWVKNLASLREILESAEADEVSSALLGVTFSPSVTATVRVLECRGHVGCLNEVASDFVVIKQA